MTGGCFLLSLGNCVIAVVVILPRRCWCDAYGRCFCFQRTMMASSAVPFVSPSTSFGAKQMVVVTTAEDDDIVRNPVCALVACWGP